MYGNLFLEIANYNLLWDIEGVLRLLKTFVDIFNFKSNTLLTFFPVLYLKFTLFTLDTNF